jgi:hypothetical protein
MKWEVTSNQMRVLTHQFYVRNVWQFDSDTSPTLAARTSAIMQSVFILRARLRKFRLLPAGLVETNVMGS